MIFFLVVMMHIVLLVMVALGNANGGIRIGNRTIPDVPFRTVLGHSSWEFSSCPPLLALGDVTSSPQVMLIESIPVAQRIAVLENLLSIPRRPEISKAVLKLSSFNMNFYGQYALASLYMTAGTLRKLVAYARGDTNGLLTAIKIANSTHDFEGFDTPMKIREWYGIPRNYPHLKPWIGRKYFRVDETIPDDEILTTHTKIWKDLMIARKRSLLLTGYESIDL